MPSGTTTASAESTRATGLPVISRVSWGAHLCQFFRTRSDLVDTLVPFFKAGLDSNERCLWIASTPFAAADCHAVLSSVVPDLDQRIARAQIEIVDHDEWYLQATRSSLGGVLESWLETEQQARQRGFDGLRISGSTFGLERRDWQSFASYEASVDRALHSRRIIALCSYALGTCGADEILEVLRNHGGALVRRGGSWETIHSATVLLAALEQDQLSQARELDFALPHGGAVGGSHGVRFFHADDYPAERIAEYIDGALALDCAGFVFATPSHLDAVSRALSARGCDVTRRIETDQLILRNAEQIASELVASGILTKAKFEGEIATLVQRAVSKFGRVRVYGEAVDLLVRDGNRAAAIQLECWWNELLQVKPLELLCGYTLTNFADAGSLAAFRRVCDEHSEVESSPAAAPPPARVLAELEHSRIALNAEVALRNQIERHRNWLRDAERVARAQAEAASDHMARLQRWTAALSEAVSVAELQDVVATELPAVLKAQRAAFALASSGLPSAVESDAFCAAKSKGFSGARRTACVPVSSGGKPQGVLDLVFESSSDAPVVERALLADCVRQLGLALDRARSYDEAERARRRLQLLAEVAAQTAQARLELTHLLQAIAQSMTQAEFAECCAINVCVEGSETLQLAAFAHVNPERGRVLENALRTTPPQLGVGLFGRVAKTGNPIRTESLDETLSLTRPEYRVQLHDHPISSLIIVPLRASGAVIGTLGVSRHPPSVPFSVDDQRLLQEVADRAALSLENALLYERARDERERAESANRAKDEFLAILGHELRNPLSPIQTAVELMRLRASDQFSKERTIIERQLRHMLRLVDDLLDVSRITRGKLQLKRAPVELAEIVADALEIASPLLEQHAHQLVTIVPLEGLLVEADRHRLAQVVANLLTNAAKYTPPGGQIEVTTSRSATRCTLSVRDNGAGIQPELLPQVFELFVQGAQGSDRRHGGLGLGLSIARTLAELHGGSLRAQSEGRGKGSVFTLELPLLDMPLRPRETFHARSLQGAERRRRVLVVDDNYDAAATLAEALERSGHEVRVAHDGPSALAVAAQFEIDLALLDIGLPVMDGYELARRLQADYSRIRLVALSGYGQGSDRERSSSCGFVEHLVKPVPLEKILSVVAHS